MSDEETKRYMARDLFLAYECGGDFFRAQIFKLIPKADAVNIIKLTSVYRDEVEAYFEWYRSPTPEEFFEKYNIGELLHGKEKTFYESRYKK